MRSFCKGLIFTFLIVLFSLLICIWIVDLQTLFQSILSCFGMGDKKDVVDQLLLRLSKLRISLLLGGFVLIFSLLLYFQNRVIKGIKIFCGWWKDAILNFYNEISALEIFIVLTIPLLASIYFAQTIPVSYDEAITYNLFTSKPFFYCIIFYPYPNNHVLHSLITNLTDLIPFFNTLFNIRIPAILATMLAWLIGYAFLKKYYSSRVALVTVGLASAMYMSIYYSFMSRGYSYIVLAFIVCMYAAFNIVYKGSKTKDWMFFIVGGILGCYAIPSFLYPFATLNVLILIYNYKNIKQQFWANIIAGTVVILLYLPIMIIDGISALTSNQFIEPLSRLYVLRYILNYYKGMVLDIVGVPVWGALFLLIPITLTVYQNNKQHLVLWLLFLLAPFVLILGHAVHPFYRTFLYYNFVIVFLIAVPLQIYLEKIPLALLILVICCIQIVGLYNFKMKVAKREGFNTDIAFVVRTYFDNDKTICFPCIASANYEFEAKVRGVEDERIFFLNNVEASADTITSYDYVILEKKRDKTISKKPYATSAIQNIYKNE